MDVYKKCKRVINALENLEVKTTSEKAGKKAKNLFLLLISLSVIKTWQKVAPFQFSSFNGFFNTLNIFCNNVDDIISFDL